MITKDSLLNDIFYPQGMGIPFQSFAKAYPVTNLRVFLPNFGAEALDSVHKDIQNSISQILKMTPLDILLEGWQKYRDVAGALEESRQNPNKAILKPLVKHTIKSEHHPYVDLTINELPVPGSRIEFEITASLEIEGVELKIQNGYITHILSGIAVGAFKLSCAGYPLAEAKTDKFTLPGEVRLRSDATKPQIIAPRF